MLYNFDAYKFDNSSMFQEAFKNTNIKCIGVANDAISDTNQEFNIMLATKPLPDIIFGGTKRLNKIALEGAMMPLDDLIEDYAPNIKEYFKDHPELKLGSLAADGKLYHIPCVLERTMPSVGFYIRTDWLRNLGLEIPTTVDEFYNVLTVCLKPQGGAPIYLRDMGQNEMGAIHELDAFLQGMAPEAREGFQMYLDEGYCTRQFPQLSFTFKEDRVINEKEPQLTTYFSEMTQKWLFGSISIEETWDEYLEIGLDEMLAAYQSAYNRYIGK